MILGLIAFLLYLYFFVGFNEVFTVVANINLAGFATFYLPALGIIVLVMSCWVLSWRFLLNSLGVRISFKNAFLYYWTGYFVDLIVPCQQICGEVTRLYLVQKETKRNYGVLGAASITNRIIGYSIVTGSLTVGLLYLLIRNLIPPFAMTILILAWGGAVAYLCVLLYLALKADGADKIASAIWRLLRVLRIKRYRQQSGLSPSLIASLQSFHEGFTFFQGKPQHLILPSVFQAISYGLSLLAYIFIFYSLGLNSLIFDFFILVYFLAGAIQDATSAFSVGGLEIILTNLFIFFGIAPATGGVAAAVLRSVIFWFPMLVGFGIAQVIGARRILNPEVRRKLEEEQKQEIFAEN